jgi:DNA-binding CsgD family transcriptional regulator/tetratricopeptide (TPR) repeat protein
MTVASSAVDDPLSAARHALERGAWSEARGRYAAIAEAEDDPGAWEGLAWASWWSDDEQATFAARERAYRAFRAIGDRRGAARQAAWLASDALDFRGDDAVAAGWLQRARDLLRDEPRSAEHGWLALMESVFAFKVTGDSAAAAARACEAAAVGRELAVPDLEALGSAAEGLVLVARGRLSEGMRRLDGAGALVGVEDFELHITPAWVMCILISACEGVGDFPRAAQWCSAMQVIGERLGGGPTVGVCRTAYGHVLATRGEWRAAETELVAAVGDLAATRPALAGGGRVRLGELRARQGRTDEARELFERALPHPPAVLGLGALSLDAGDAEAAADAADRALRRTEPTDVLARIPAQELLVRARLALGDVAGAARASAALTAGAARLGTPYLDGRARLVVAELEAARGRLQDARRAAEDAADRFAACAAPYEVARSRAVLAGILRALGREPSAAAEARAARETFLALGATRDAERLVSFARPPRPAPVAAVAAGELTAREVEVLRLVAQGLSDAQIARSLIVSPHTVHRHVANVRTKLALPSRAAAVGHAARLGLL